MNNEAQIGEKYKNQLRLRLKFTMKVFQVKIWQKLSV